MDDGDASLAYCAPVLGAADVAILPPEVEAGEASSVPNYTLPTSPRRAMATLIALSAAAFLVVTNEITPLGLITLISEDLGRSKSEVGLLTTAFALTVMLATVPLTLLTTRLSRRWLLVGTMVVWSLGVLLVATSDTFSQLLVGRIVTALAHAVFWAVVTPAAAGMFPPHIRGRSVTRLLIGASGAGVIGLPAATWLAQGTDWHVPFYVLAIAGGVLAVTIGVLMPNFRTEEGTAARGDYPSMRRYLRVLAVTFLSMTAMSTTWTYITPYFTDVAKFAASSVPVLLMVGGAVGVVSMWLVGRYLDKWPVKSVALGLSLAVVMWVGLSLFGSNQPVAVAMVMLQGFAWSIVVAAMVNWAMRHTPWSSDIGVGTYASTFNGGNAVGSVLGAGMLAWWGASWLPYASLALTSVALLLVWTAGPGLRATVAQRPRRRA